MTPTRTCRPALFVVSVLELTACVTLVFAGCASHTISDHRGMAPNVAPVPGYYGQTVRVVTGGLVETIQLDEVDGITHYVHWTTTSSDPQPGKAVFEVSIGRGRAAAP